MGRFVQLYMHQNLWIEADEWSRLELQCRIVFSGPDDDQTLVSMRQRAYILSKQGQCMETEELVRRVLDILSRTLGRDDLRTLAARVVLAGILGDTRRTKRL